MCICIELPARFRQVTLIFPLIVSIMSIQQNWLQQGNLSLTICRPTLHLNTLYYKYQVVQSSKMDMSVDTFCFLNSPQPPCNNHHATTTMQQPPCNNLHVCSCILHDDDAARAWAAAQIYTICSFIHHPEFSAIKRMYLHLKSRAGMMPCHSFSLLQTFIYRREVMIILHKLKIVNVEIVDGNASCVLCSQRTEQPQPQAHAFGM